MMDPILTVTTNEIGQHVAVLSAAGEIDHDSRTILGDAADAVIRQGRDRLVVDLAGVTFCDSGGLSLFVDLHRRTAALCGRFHLAGARPAVSAVLQATNLDRLLAVHPTVEEAVDASTAAG